ncbi:MAG TPA: SAVED domain-containing protein [Baekduia sp.]|nr:SAVED domain-containing protein [Baekduia sp.]
MVEQRQPDAAVVTKLAETVIDAKSCLEFLRDASAALGWDASAARLRPGRERVRRGDFGEALAAAWLAEHHDVVVPIPKLRYQVSASQTQPGTDLLGMAIATEPLAVQSLHFTECKLRTTRSLSAGEDAHEQLVEHRDLDYAETLAFVLERLWWEERDLYEALKSHLVERQDDDSSDRFEIALIYEDESWDEEVLQRVEDVGGALAGLRIHSVRLAELRRLVDQAFAAINPDIVIEEDPEDTATL